jgi:fatty-acyl-CoA synthase
MPPGIYESDLEKREANYTPLTPLNFLRRAALAYPQHAAIIHGDLRYDYRTFHERCVRLASGLDGLGVGPGDTVAMLAPNIPAALEALFAVPMLGAVLNMINIRLDAATVAYILEHSETKVFIADREFGSTAKDALGRLQEKPHLIEIDDALAEERTPIGGEDYEAFLDSGDPDFDWPGITDEWQAISLNYTSGTTGDPKGVVFHHRGAYITTLSNALVHRFTPQPVYLWTLPLFHCNGWTNGWVVTALAGTHICLRRMDPAEVFRLIDTHEVSHMSGAPIVLNALLNAPPDVRRKTAHVIEFTTGGAAPPAAVLEKSAEIGFNITHAYGLTESYGPASSCAWHGEWNDLSLGERARKMERQGIANLSIDDMAVLDPETLAPVPADGETMGEIMLRGNTIMKGYLKDAPATAACFEGDWFHTGDLATVEPDGYVLIKDRSKDIIISGGENISSLEIESVLYHHPAVLEAAVVARADERWGESPCAFITLKPDKDATNAEEIIAFCRKNMAHFKAPKTVIFGPLPKTATGKIQKFMLREKVRALGPREEPEAS